MDKWGARKGLSSGVGMEFGIRDEIWGETAKIKCHMKGSKTWYNKNLLKYVQIWKWSTLDCLNIEETEF